MTSAQAQLFPTVWRWRGHEGTSSAKFSPCMRYRYELRRTWNAGRPPLIVCALNPSTATELVEDPTVRRLLAFADRWTCGSLILLNIFALRSTDPKALRATIKAGGDPEGPDNTDTIRAVFRDHKADKLLLAWGGHGTLQDRGREIASVAMVEHGRPECFGLTKNGQPSHALYLPDASVPHLYEQLIRERASSRAA